MNVSRTVDELDGREYSPPPVDDDDMDQIVGVVQPEVRFLTDEDILQYRPTRYARSEPAEEVGQVGYPPFPYMPTSSYGSNDAAPTLGTWVSGVAGGGRHSAFPA